MPQVILGIDIGSYSVKIAELHRSFKSFEFVHFYERKIQYNELLKPEEATSAALQGMIDDFGLKGDQVIVGYSGTQVSSRNIELPFGNLNKIDQTIEFELESFIPFPLEGVLLDYYIMESAKDFSKVLTFYTLRNDFEKWLTWLQGCQLDPKIVTPESSEYLNLVHLGMIPPESPYCILDIGHTKTNVIICKGKKMEFVRTLSLGGLHLTEAVQKKLNVPWEEAERLKIAMGGLGEDLSGLDDISKQVVGALQDVVAEITVAIRQTLFAFQDRQKEVVEGIFLCGGTARLAGIDRHLSIKLKQNVSFIDPTGFHFTHIDKNNSHWSVMPQGLAIALRGVASAGMPSLNFRRGDLAYKGDVENLGGGIRHLGLAAGVVLLMGLVYFVMRYVSLSTQIKQQQKSLVTMVQQNLPGVNIRDNASPKLVLQTIQGEQSKTQDRLTRLQELEGVAAVDLVKEISQKLPSREELKIDLEDFNLKGERLSLSGRVDSFVAVDKIKASLESSRFLQKVTPGNVGKGIKEGEVKFEMTMDVVPRGKE